jgi:hypothetical protein
MAGITKKRKIELEKLEIERTKVCNICGKIKPLFEFTVRADCRKTANAHCIECERERERHYKRKYNITLKEYEELLEQQGGKCAICGSIKPGGKNKFVFCMDHDHETGKIRELLCHYCNKGLGDFKDNPEFLVAAAAYILKHKEKE